MRRPVGRRGVAVALAGVLGLAVTSCGLPAPSDDPADVAAEFVAALAARDLPAASELTTDPDAAATDLARVLEGMGTATLSARVEEAGASEFRYTSEWVLGEDRGWSYRTIVPLVPGPDGPRVAWSPAVVSPGSWSRRGARLSTPDSPKVRLSPCAVSAHPYHRCSTTRGCP